jgi:hypothetical protein
MPRSPCIRPLVGLPSRQSRLGWAAGGYGIRLAGTDAKGSADTLGIPPKHDDLRRDEYGLSQNQRGGNPCKR